jgi:hypothetical protein
MLVTLKRESASDAVEGGGGYDRLDDVPTSNHVTTTDTFTSFDNVARSYRPRI